MQTVHHATLAFSTTSGIFDHTGEMSPAYVVTTSPSQMRIL
jgi:hypothetical protein